MFLLSLMLLGPDRLAKCTSDNQTGWASYRDAANFHCQRGSQRNEDSLVAGEQKLRLRVTLTQISEDKRQALELSQ